MNEDKQLEMLIKLSNQIASLHVKHDTLNEKITKLDISNDHYKAQLDLAVKLQSKYGEQIDDLQKRVEVLEDAISSTGINFAIKHPKITIAMFAIVLMFAVAIVNFTINNYDAKQHPVLHAIDHAVDTTTGIDKLQGG